MRNPTAYLIILFLCVYSVPMEGKRRGTSKTCLLPSTANQGNGQIKLFFDTPVPRGGLPTDCFVPKKKYVNLGYGLGDIISSAIPNVLTLHKNLFSWNTFKVAATAFPLFVAARMFDEKLQNCFYKRSCHKNINQMPDWCREVARLSIGIPVALLGVDAFFSGDDEKRWMAQILMLGLPFVIWTKKMVRKIDCDLALRPWNEHFSCDTRAHGGFPSGHMAQAIYMTVLYGSRFGPAYAIPLGFIASFLGINFLTCNRHYASQLVAGGAFGAMYALAASAVIDSRLAEQIDFGLASDDAGRPGFSLTFRW